MKRLLQTLFVAALVVGALHFVASYDRCGRWERSAPVLRSAVVAQGALKAGAAREPISPPYPVVVAGYGPPRAEVTRAAPELEARAVVLEVPPVKVAIVSVDLLLVPDQLATALRTEGSRLGFASVIVTATHAHSSMGGFDPRWASQLAGTGNFRWDAVGAVEDAAARALRRADQQRASATLLAGSGALDGLVRPRSGTEVDAKAKRFTVKRGEVTLAELWIVAAHPALEARKVQALSPDYPGFADPNDGPVTLVLQGAVGNASARVPEGDGGAPVRYAKAVAERVHAVPLTALERPVLGIAQVTASYPRPDSERLVPRVARAAADNLLCQGSARSMELKALRIGDSVLLALPFEPSFGAAAVLREQSGVDQVLALADGYGGYLEPADVVRAGGGEAKRQYFGPELLDVVKDAAKLAVDAVRPRAKR